MSYNRVTLLLSIQGALLGSVTPNLRMVTAEGDDEEIRLIFYYDGEISEDDYEMADIAATEIISNFTTQGLNLKIERLDAPKKMKFLTLLEITNIYKNTYLT